MDYQVFFFFWIFLFIQLIKKNKFGNYFFFQKWKKELFDGYILDFYFDQKLYLKDNQGNIRAFSSYNFSFDHPYPAFVDHGKNKGEKKKIR